VDDQQNESDVGTPVMQGPHELQAGCIADITDAGMGDLWRRVIKLGQYYSSDDCYGEANKCDSPERVPKRIGMGGNRII